MAATMLSVSEKEKQDKNEIEQCKSEDSNLNIKEEPKGRGSELLNINESRLGLAYSLLIDSKRPSRLPPSSVLSKVKLFLPDIKAANEDLMSKTDECVGLELPNDYDGPAIQIDLTQFALASSDESSDDEDLQITEHNIQTSVTNQKLRPSIEILAATGLEQPSCIQPSEGVMPEDATVK